MFHISFTNIQEINVTIYNLNIGLPLALKYFICAGSIQSTSRNYKSYFESFSLFKPNIMVPILIQIRLIVKNTLTDRTKNIPLFS